MRKVVVSGTVRDRIAEVNDYLTREFRLSATAADKRTDSMEDFVLALANEADYPRCRFKRWRALGYRCAVFEGDWIFAYEIFDEGVIVRDMSHAKLMKE